MTTKTKTLVAAGIVAFFEFIRYITTLPPEQQVGMLHDLTAIFPQQWQPQIGLWSTVIARLLAIYTAFSAARSGPQTPPQNPPQ